MVTGAHMVLNSKDAEADREFFRSVLGFPSVDAGFGWLIFALPGAEAAIHPAETNGGHEMYLICDDLADEVARLGRMGVVLDPVSEQRWGLLTRIHLPGGGTLGLYQPTHPTTLARA